MNQRYIKKIKSFHGHIGPYVIVGYRMGQFAKLKLGIIDSVSVHTRMIPPESCVLDGIQLSTGCTIGRGVFKAKNKKGCIKATFLGKGKRLTVNLSALLLTALRTSHSQALKLTKTSKNDILFTTRLVKQ